MSSTDRILYKCRANEGERWYQAHYWETTTVVKKGWRDLRLDQVDVSRVSDVKYKKCANHGGSK